MSMASIDRLVAVSRKKLAALSNAQARDIDLMVRDAEQDICEALSAPEPAFYDIPDENLNPFKQFCPESLSLSALVSARSGYIHTDNICMMAKIPFGQNTSYLLRLHNMKKLLKAGQAQGYELPYCQQAIRDHQRYYPSAVREGFCYAARFGAHVLTCAVGVYALATLAVTGVMREEAEKTEATFAPEKLTAVAGSSWSANVSEGVLIKGRLPKMGAPAVQVYKVATQEFCAVTQVRKSLVGISERAYQETCQTVDYMKPESRNAFMPPLAAWHKAIGSPETEGSLRTRFEALAAQYTNLETQETALKKALGLTKEAKHQTATASDLLIGAKP